MPIYDFVNKETGEVISKLMTYENKLKYLSENPNMDTIILGAPSLVTTHGDGVRRKAGREWQDMLSRVADANPHSTLAQDHGKKDPTSVKVRQVVNKHKNDILNS